MKVVWTHEFVNRLISIEEFIADDSPTRANRFITQIITKTSPSKSIQIKVELYPSSHFPNYER